MMLNTHAGVSDPALGIHVLRYDGQRCVVDHGDNGDRHVGTHDIRVRHAQEQHECHPVSHAEATCRQTVKVI